jgi:multicomponent K+:H+ antiporter subunit E
VAGDGYQVRATDRLAALATMTPGTLSADLSEDHSQLLVHAFDIDDEAAQAALIAELKARYETPLIRIALPLSHRAGVGSLC